MIKLFGEWDTSNIKVGEAALAPYIDLKPLMVPRTCGRSAQGSRVWGTKIHIVERLINKLMVPGHRGKKHKISSGHCAGKATKSYNIVFRTFKLIEKSLGKNPVEVFVKAVENSAPREEVISIEYGGARYTKAVEVAPQRRVDLVLKLMAQGAYAKAFNSKVDVERTLANEIIAAYKMDVQASGALSKKLDLERQSDASR